MHGTGTGGTTEAFRRWCDEASRILELGLIGGKAVFRKFCTLSCFKKVKNLMNVEELHDFKGENYD